MRTCSALIILLFAAHLARAGEDAALITSEDIAREKPADLVEMLRSRVGLDESNSVITMRGVRGIAILVDGFASSMAELKALKPEQVERIEILRGAASDRFGAEAMGGAIAVTTRKTGTGKTEALKASLVQGLDSRLGRYTRLGGSREADGLGWSLLAERRAEQGFQTVPASPFPYQITVDDEARTSSLADGTLSWRSRGLDLSLNLKRDTNWSYFGRPAWVFDWHTDNARAQLLWKVTEATTLEASLGEERYTAQGIRDRGTGIDAPGLAPQSRLAQAYRQREATTALAWQEGGRQLRLGANLVELREDFGNADFYTGDTRLAATSVIRRQAAFASAEWPLGAGRLELGLRRDLQRYASYQVYSPATDPATTSGGGVLKSATSPRLALSWPLGENYRLRGSLGTGFSPPQASQLYNGYASAGAVTLANPALKPERSTTLDLALSQASPAGEWSLTLFATRWQDKINTRILDYGTPSVQQPQNVGLSIARGLEAQWSRRFLGVWSVAANYTYTRTRIQQDLSDPGLEGHELPDMPRHKANLTVGWEPGDGFTARSVLRAVGPAYTDDANRQEDDRGYRWKKAGYWVLDLTATWRRPTWEFTLALANAFNRDYVTGFFWHGEPRTLRGELTIRY